LSLQGTLDTFSLPEILELVEKSRKTGALEVRDPQSRGVLYFAGGRFSAAEAGELCGPVESTEELEARLIDVCFALFRVETGLFEFENDRFPPWPVRGGSEIAPVVEQVQQLRRDWLAIEAVLPSLECRPGAVDDLDGDRVVLDKAGFRVLRAVDGERNIREIARTAGRSVLEVCKVLKDLVEAGAVTVPTAPDRTMVDELVLPADPAAGAEPAADPDWDVESDPVSAAFPERTADEFEDLPELPEVPGLVVPSSPEGLTARGFEPEYIEGSYEAGSEPGEQPEPAPIRLDPGEPAPVPDPAEHEYGAEAREAEQSGEAAAEAATAEGTEEDGDDGEPAPDRGALLRLFSSLRDT
jgi:hypothetical protein